MHPWALERRLSWSRDQAAGIVNRMILSGIQGQGRAILYSVLAYLRGGVGYQPRGSVEAWRISMEDQESGAEVSAATKRARSK